MSDFHENGLEAIFNVNSNFKLIESKLVEKEEFNISKVRASILLDQPFFGYVLGHFKIGITKEDVLGRFAADSQFLYFNLEFLSKLFSHENWKLKLREILFHMVLHLIYKHHLRGEHRNPRLWSIATDIVLYQIMLDFPDLLQLETWSLGSVRDIPHFLLNKSSEEIYDILEEFQELQKKPKPDDSSSGLPNKPQERENQSIEEFMEVVIHKDGEVDANRLNSRYQNIHNFLCDGDQITKNENEKGSDSDLSAEILDGIIRRSRDISKDRGSLPGDLALFIDKMVNPVLNWRTLLNNYLQTTLPHDYNWAHPNRRLIEQGYYFPSELKENLTVTAILDTSGSIDNSQLGYYLNELHSMLQSIQNVALIVIDADSRIQQINTYESGESVSNHIIMGKGGTDFRPALEKAVDLNSDLIIYFTDGDGIYPKEPLSNIPILWIVTTEIEPPFGQVIHINPMRYNLS